MSGSMADGTAATPEAVVILPRTPLLLTPIGLPEDASGVGPVCEGDSCAF